MRFERLDIVKYGNCDALQADFSGTPGLTVVYGPNEAGKSTTLNAVVDMLFGIPVRSPRMSVFGGPAISLSSTLRLANGDQLSVRRTKGNTRTLFSGDGMAMDEAVLQAHLGANDRERFLALFALDHASLRSGGERLLDAKGDIGRLIVEAGGGMRSLVADMDQLASRADLLYGTRKSDKRAFYIELDKYQQADRDVKAGLLTVEAYSQAQRDAVKAEQRVTKLSDDLRLVREQLQQLNRMNRVLPILAELARYHAAMEAYADVESLDSKLPERIRRALDNRTNAREAATKAEARRLEVQKQIDASPVPENILAAEAAIRDIVEAAIHVGKERENRANRIANLETSHAKLDGLRSVTGIGEDDDIGALLPSAKELERVRGMASDATRNAAERRSEELQLKQTVAKTAELNAQIKRAEASGWGAPPGFDPVRLAGLDGLSRELSSRRDELRRRQDDQDRRLAAAGFDSVPSLQSLAIPDDAAIQREIDRRVAADRALDEQNEIVASQTHRKAAQGAEIAALRTGGEVPTPEAIGTARGQRDKVWKDIRQGYLGVPELSSDRERAESADRYETLTRSADTLADQKSVEADRIARLQLAQQELAEAESLIIAAKHAIDLYSGRVKEGSEAWAACWPEAVKVAPEPARLKLLAGERTELLSQSKVLAESSAEMDRIAREVDATEEALAAAEVQLGIVPGAARLAERVSAVTALAKRHEAEYADYRNARRSLDEASAQKERLELAINEHVQFEVEWRKQWVELMARLRLDGDSPPEFATEAAAKWAEARGVLDNIAQTKDRLSKMDRDEGVLRSTINAASPGLGMTLPDDPIAAAQMLKHRLDDATKLKTARYGLEQQGLVLEAAEEVAANALRMCEAEVRALCSEADCEEQELAAAAQRIVERDVCRSDILQAERRLFESGDQMPAEALRSTISDRSLDEIVAAIKQAEEDEIAIQAERDSAIKEHQQHEHLLAQFTGSAEMNVPVGRRESAAAALRQIMFDYVELEAARRLIGHAIGVVREESQDPMLARAGALFSRTTRESFGGIQADVDDKGAPSVVGIRKTGECVKIEEMSDGTRDQLFLAFRVAAVEQYCASAEPLPFIGDDLLVHFDDPRTEAALELLAELGKTTQVLLFTHHAFVRDAAAGLVKRGLAGVVELN